MKIFIQFATNLVFEDGKNYTILNNQTFWKETSTKHRSPSEIFQTFSFQNLVYLFIPILCDHFLRILAKQLSSTFSKTIVSGSVIRFYTNATKHGHSDLASIFCFFTVDVKRLYTGGKSGENSIKVFAFELCKIVIIREFCASISNRNCPFQPEVLNVFNGWRGLTLTKVQAENAQGDTWKNPYTCFTL